ncbi:trkA-N domain protein [Mycobacterium kansasii]|uniref:TrkA-N domain protein n=1 Tax=Mycobacterium kansasii TaxID=1768 RepID=A0A1V3XJW8_MYCKA|nr:trkA-N domain protein [Mycobacterium kansasii]
MNPMFYRALAAMAVLLVGSTILLRFAYLRPPGMTWLDALYFSTETIATVGYGDFSFAHQPTWLRVFSISLMFAGVTLTAILVAFLADLLLSRRFTRSAGRMRVRHLRNHVIVVGLGSFGIRVVRDLTAAGYDVAVIELDENSRYLSSAAELEVPVIFGDATLPQTLESACVAHARAVAVLTQDDMVNVEAGIVLREMLGGLKAKGRSVPLVLRVYDRTLGTAVAQRFGFESVRSTVELAAPWFIGAAMGLQVLGTFSVGKVPSWWAECKWASAANSTGCRCTSCQPIPGSSRSPGPTSRSPCIRAGRHGCGPATPSISSAPTASCWRRYARANPCSSARSVACPRRRLVDLQCGNHVGGATKLIDVSTGRDQLNLIGADLVELSQHRQQLLLTTRPAGHRRHGIDVFGRDPVHVVPQVTMHLRACLIRRPEGEPERRPQVWFGFACFGPGGASNVVELVLPGDVEVEGCSCEPVGPCGGAAKGLWPDCPDEQRRAAGLHRRRPIGRRDSVIFSPAQTRFMTATRSAMPRIVCVEQSAPRRGSPPAGRRSRLPPSTCHRSARRRWPGLWPAAPGDAIGARSPSSPTGPGRSRRPAHPAASGCRGCRTRCARPSTATRTVRRLLRAPTS